MYVCVTDRMREGEGDRQGWRAAGFSLPSFSHKGFWKALQIGARDKQER